MPDGRNLYILSNFIILLQNDGGKWEKEDRKKQEQNDANMAENEED